MPPAARGSFEKPPLDPTKLLFRVFFAIFSRCSIVNDFLKQGAQPGIQLFLKLDSGRGNRTIIMPGPDFGFIRQGQ
jgi:hypothetical protein